MRRVLPLVLAGFLTTAATSGAAEVVVFGELAEESNPIAVGSAVSVSYYPGPQAKTLTDRLRDGIARELDLRGHTVTGLEDSQYHVFFGFGTRSVPGERFYSSNELDRRPDTEVVYIHYFSLTVIDAPAYRNDGNERLLWSGEARLDEVVEKDPTKPLKLLDRLLIASMEVFGEDQPWTYQQALHVEPATVVVQHILIGYGRTLAKRARAPQVWRPVDGEEFRHPESIRSWRPPVKNNVDRTKPGARILVERLLARIDSGESFDDLEREYSDDIHPGVYTLANKGVPMIPGTWPRKTMPVRFAEVAFTLEVGEIGVSKYHAHKSTFGWHIIKRIE